MRDLHTTNVEAQKMYVGQCWDFAEMESCSMKPKRPAELLSMPNHARTAISRLSMRTSRDKLIDFVNGRNHRISSQARTPQRSRSPGVSRVIGPNISRCGIVLPPFLSGQHERSGRPRPRRGVQSFDRSVRTWKKSAALDEQASQTPGQRVATSRRFASG